MNSTLISKLKSDSKNRANEYFLLHKNELKNRLKKDTQISLVFCQLSQIIESNFALDGCYQITYEIRAGDNLAIAYYEIMFEYSPEGEPLDDYCAEV